MPYILNPDGSVYNKKTSNIFIPGIQNSDVQINFVDILHNETNDTTNNIGFATNTTKEQIYNQLLNKNEVDENKKQKKIYAIHEELTDWDEFTEGFSIKETVDESKILNDVPLNHGTKEGNLLADPETVKSYKPLYSFLSDNSDSGLYAQEFEIKTGYRSPIVDGQNKVDIFDIYTFLINYIADVAIQVVFIEGVKLVNMHFLMMQHK